ncbi:MAG: radical SAM protein [Candidatus Omnitrophica bacterium]|nr:radical SAM protein [Candidatus Omnitrophota bacterium]
MRILFVWPNKDQFGFKPIGLSLLSALLKENGHQVEIFDTTFIDFGFKDNTEVRSKLKIFKPVDFSGYDISKKNVSLEETFLKRLSSFNPDIVAVSALSDELYIGIELSAIAKKWKQSVCVLWGNKLATMCPEKVLSYDCVDYLCVGEGIEFIKEFVAAFEKKADILNIKNLAYRDKYGRIVKNELRPFYQDLDALPFLDWSIFDGRQFLKPYDGKVYIGGDYMMYWGCPLKCTYCINASYRDLYGKNAGKFLRSYSVDRIIDELKYLVKKWKIQFFKFHDEDFFLKPLEEFSYLAKRYSSEIGVPFTVMANARNVTKEKAELVKKMNCRSVTLGIETGNERIRKEILKRTETAEQIISASRMLNSLGIRTAAFNMLAIPFETRETIMETIELNKKAEIVSPNAGFFFPLEGTELRTISIENGFFSEDSNAVFKNDRPTLKFSDILEEELVALRERFVLYIKMPESLYKYIKRSEKNDSLGKRLTKELYLIYDEAVFSNDGLWNKEADIKGYTKRLEDVFLGG